MKKSGVKVVDRYAEFLRNVRDLTKRDVLVGVPAKNAERMEKGQPINNAILGYIHEYGAPAAGIPPRPHLIPGIKDAEPKTIPALKHAAESALKGNAAGVTSGLNAAGMAAVSSVKGLIRSGIQPPLSDATLEARARRVKSRKAEQAEIANRAAGKPPSVDLVKPLIDTGNYINSITYVIAKK